MRFLHIKFSNIVLGQTQMLTITLIKQGRIMAWHKLRPDEKHQQDVDNFAVHNYPPEKRTLSGGILMNYISLVNLVIHL